MNRRARYVSLALTCVAAGCLSWFYGPVALVLGASWAFLIGRMAESQGAEKANRP